MKNPAQLSNAIKPMRTLLAHAVGSLQPIVLMLARHLVFPLVFLGTGLMLAQPCVGAPFQWETIGSLAADQAVDDSEYLTSTELYDSANGRWSRTGDMGAARSEHTATLLPSGLVLVAGGFDGNGVLTSAELYDPSSGIWSATGSLTTGRNRHTATLLPNGMVLVAGGASGSGQRGTL